LKPVKPNLLLLRACPFFGYPAKIESYATFNPGTQKSGNPGIQLLRDPAGDHTKTNEVEVVVDEVEA